MRGVDAGGGGSVVVVLRGYRAWSYAHQRRISKTLNATSLFLVERKSLQDTSRLPGFVFMQAFERGLLFV